MIVYVSAIGYGIYSVLKNDIVGMLISLGILAASSVCIGVYIW